MRTSHYLLSTLKQTPSDAEIISHQLMLRAGLIRRVTSGIYTWLPMGLRILRKVEAIIRSEMNRSGALELLMPSIQPSELWQESGRWEAYGDLMLRIQDRHQRTFCFGPTHEEVITDLMRNEIKSYKQLPLNFYQIQTKFRDELRPRFGVMRAREFLMKDAYSFHLTPESLSETYQVMYDTYHRIFTRLGLQFRAVMADTGDIGGSYSHEFQVLAQSGEDTILYSDQSDYAANVELCKGKVGDKSPDGIGYLKEARGIEVGHIFQLGDKYSTAMNATVLDETGKTVTLHMGCYGIGVSRIVAACIEQNYDDCGIVFPEPMAPFQIALVPINSDNVSIRETTENLYTELQNLGFEVLMDDREERPGVKFADIELIGIPHRIVISERGLKAGTFEYTYRKTRENQMLTYEEIVDYLSSTLQKTS